MKFFVFLGMLLSIVAQAHIEQDDTLVNYILANERTHVQWLSEACRFKLFEWLQYIPKQPEESFFSSGGFSSKLFMLNRAIAIRQWSLAPAPLLLENFEEPTCQIPDSSGYFGIILNSTK